MTNKLVVIINSLKVPKMKKILLYEMKFLVPNYSCLQNPREEGYRPQIPVLSVLCQLNLLNPPSEQNSWVRHCLILVRLTAICSTGWWTLECCVWLWYFTCVQYRVPLSAPQSNLYYTLLFAILGDGGSTAVKVPCYKSEGLWLDSRWCHWNFSLT